MSARGDEPNQSDASAHQSAMAGLYTHKDSRDDSVVDAIKPERVRGGGQISSPTLSTQHKMVSLAVSPEVSRGPGPYEPHTTEAEHEQQQQQQRQQQSDRALLCGDSVGLTHTLTSSPSSSQMNGNSNTDNTAAAAAHATDTHVSSITPTRPIRSVSPRHDLANDNAAPLSDSHKNMHTLHLNTPVSARAQTAPALRNNVRHQHFAPPPSAHYSPRASCPSNRRAIPARNSSSAAAHRTHLAGRIRPWSASELMNKRSRGAHAELLLQQSNRYHPLSASSLSSSQSCLLLRFFDSKRELDMKQQEHQQKEYQVWRDFHLSKSFYMNFSTSTMNSRALHDIRKESEPAKPSLATAQEDTCDGGMLRSATAAALVCREESNALTEGASTDRAADSKSNDNNGKDRSSLAKYTAHTEAESRTDKAAVGVLVSARAALPCGSAAITRTHTSAATSTAVLADCTSTHHGPLCSAQHTNGEVLRFEWTRMCALQHARQQSDKERAEREKSFESEFLQRRRRNLYGEALDLPIMYYENILQELHGETRCRNMTGSKSGRRAEGGRLGKDVDRQYNASAHGGCYDGISSKDHYRACVFARQRHYYQRSMKQEARRAGRTEMRQRMVSQVRQTQHNLSDFRSAMQAISRSVLLKRRRHGNRTANSASTTATDSSAMQSVGHRRALCKGRIGKYRSKSSSFMWTREVREKEQGITTTAAARQKQQQQAERKVDDHSSMSASESHKSDAALDKSGAEPVHKATVVQQRNQCNEGTAGQTVLQGSLAPPQASIAAKRSQSMCTAGNAQRALPATTNDRSMRSTIDGGCDSRSKHAYRTTTPSPATASTESLLKMHILQFPPLGTTPHPTRRNASMHRPEQDHVQRGGSLRARSANNNSNLCVDGNNNSNTYSGSDNDRSKHNRDACSSARAVRDAQSNRREEASQPPTAETMTRTMQAHQESSARREWLKSWKEAELAFNRAAVGRQKTAQAVNVASARVSNERERCATAEKVREEHAAATQRRADLDEADRDYVVDMHKMQQDHVERLRWHRSEQREQRSCSARAQRDHERCLDDFVKRVEEAYIQAMRSKVAAAR